MSSRIHDDYPNSICLISFHQKIVLLICCGSSLGDSGVNVYINHEKKLAFVEMRSVKEASNDMALDGINFQVL